MAVLIKYNGLGGKLRFSGASTGGFKARYVLSTSPLLLDTYPGAAAAYSLRKLSSTYNGSAIRIRRSSDNAETDIGFVSNTLDTASLLTFCGVGNGFITTWYDQSGNIKNATQATATNQPRIVTSGLYLGYLIFDGNDDNLISTTGSSIPWNGSTGAHIVTVTSPNVGLVNGAFDFAATVNVPFTGAWGIIYHTVGPTFLKWRFGTGEVNNAELYTRTSSTAFCIVNTNKNSSTETLYLNNSLVKTVTGKLTTLANNSPTTIHISFAPSAGGYWGGFQKEIVMYNINQSANVDGINTNINSFYTIY